MCFSWVWCVVDVLVACRVWVCGRVFVRGGVIKTKSSACAQAVKRRAVGHDSQAYNPVVRSAAFPVNSCHGKSKQVLFGIGEDERGIY